MIDLMAELKANLSVPPLKVHCPMCGKYLEYKSVLIEKLDTVILEASCVFCNVTRKKEVSAQASRASNGSVLADSWSILLRDLIMNMIRVEVDAALIKHRPAAPLAKQKLPKLPASNEAYPPDAQDGTFVDKPASGSGAVLGTNTIEVLSRKVIEVALLDSQDNVLMRAPVTNIPAAKNGTIEFPAITMSLT